MTEETTDKVIAHLREKWQGGKCPMCGTTGGWSLSNCAFYMRELGDGPHVIPLVAVVCDNCGLVLPASATKLGAVTE